MVSPLVGGIGLGFAQASRERSAATAAAKEAADARTFTAGESAKDRTFRAEQNKDLMQNRLDVAEAGIKQRQDTAKTNRSFQILHKLRENAGRQRSGIVKSSLDANTIDHLDHIDMKAELVNGIYIYPFHNAIKASNQVQMDTNSKNVMDLKLPFGSVSDAIQQNIADLHFGGDKVKASAVIGAMYQKEEAKQSAAHQAEILSSRPGITSITAVPGDPFKYVNTGISHTKAILDAVPSLGEEGVRRTIQGGNAQPLIKIGELANMETQIGEALVTGETRTRAFLQKFVTQRLKEDFKNVVGHPYIHYKNDEGSDVFRPIKVKERFPNLHRLLLDQMTFPTVDPKIQSPKDISAAIAIATKGKIKLTPFAVKYKMAEGTLTIGRQEIPAAANANPERTQGSETVITVTDGVQAPDQKTSTSQSSGNTALEPLGVTNDKGELETVSFDPIIRTVPDVQAAISLINLRAVAPNVFKQDPEKVARYTAFKPYYDSIHRLTSLTDSPTNISQESIGEYEKLYDMIDQGILQTDGSMKKIFNLQGTLNRDKLIKAAIKEGMVRMLSLGVTETGGTAEGSSWGIGKTVEVQTKVNKKSGKELKDAYPAVYRLRENAFQTKEKLDLVMPQVAAFSRLRERIGAIDTLLELDDIGGSSRWDNPEGQAHAQRLREQILNDPQVAYHIKLVPDDKVRSNWDKFINSSAIAGSRSEGFMPKWLNTTAQFIKDAYYTTKMAGGMFNIGNFGGRRINGQTVNGSGLMRLRVDRDGKPANAFYNENGQPIYAKTWSTPGDKRGEEIGRQVHTRFENEVLPELQRVHAQSMEKAQQAFKDAELMAPGNAQKAAMDNASLKILKSYLMARRDFLKVSLTYYYAGLVQGESGGRAISNEDYQILFNALWGNVGGVLAAGAFDQFRETVTGIQERNAANIKYLGLGPDTVIADAVVSLQRTAEKVTNRTIRDQAALTVNEQRAQIEQKPRIAEIPSKSFNIGAFGPKTKLSLRANYNEVVGPVFNELASQYAGTSRKFMEYTDPATRKGIFKNVVRSVNDKLNSKKQPDLPEEERKRNFRLQVKRLNTIPGGDFKLGDTIVKYGKLLDAADKYKKFLKTEQGSKPNMVVRNGKRVESGKTQAYFEYDLDKKEIGMTDKETKWLFGFVENFFNSAITSKKR